MSYTSPPVPPAAASGDFTGRVAIVTARLAVLAAPQRRVCTSAEHSWP